MNFTNVATIVALAAATSAYASTTSATLGITEYRAAIEKCKDSKDETAYKTCMEDEKILSHQLLPFDKVNSELKDETISELLAKEDPAVVAERERLASEAEAAAAKKVEDEKIAKEAAEAAAKLVSGKRATLKEVMEAHKTETDEAKYIAALEAAKVDAAVAKEAFKHREATVDDTLLATLIPEAPVASAASVAPATTDVATKTPFYKNIWFIGGSAVALLALGGGAYMLTRKSDETDL